MKKWLKSNHKWLLRAILGSGGVVGLIIAIISLWHHAASKKTTISNTGSGQQIVGPGTGQNTQISNGPGGTVIMNPSPQAPAPAKEPHPHPSPAITQSSAGGNSPNIAAGGDVTINPAPAPPDKTEPPK